jgi:hypothetical protein
VLSPATCRTTCSLPCFGTSRRIIAEALVIDGATPELGGDGLTAAGRLALEVRGLPGYVCMPSGIRWCKIPIVIVVENDEMMRRAYGDPLLRSFTLASAHPGWDNAYQAVAKAVHTFGEQLVEEFLKAGWRLREEYGRHTRVQSPKLRRVGDRFQHIETELDDGNHDEWYRSRTKRDRMRLSLIHTDQSAVPRDIDTLRRTMAGRYTEPTYQAFMNIRTYFLGAAPYELTSQAPLRDPDTGEMRYADYAYNRIQLSAYDEPSRIIDLSVPQAPLLVRARKYYKLGGEYTTGIAQLTGYRSNLEDPRSAEDLRVLFPDGGPLSRGLLVAGTLANVDRGALEAQRHLYREVVDITLRWLAERVAPEIADAVAARVGRQRSARRSSSYVRGRRDGVLLDLSADLPRRVLASALSSRSCCRCSSSAVERCQPPRPGRRRVNPQAYADDDAGGRLPLGTGPHSPPNTPPGGRPRLPVHEEEP